MRKKAKNPAKFLLKKNCRFERPVSSRWRGREDDTRNRGDSPSLRVVTGLKRIRSFRRRCNIDMQNAEEMRLGLPLDFAPQPRPRVGPEAFGGTRREAQCR